mgnify:CR=1 FL=1
MQSIVGCITLMKIISGTLNTKNLHNVTPIYPNHAQPSVGRQLEWQYTRTDGQVRYLLAPNLEQAAWSAAELSGGSQFLKNVKQTYEW